jgi:hypothetical protein
LNIFLKFKDPAFFKAIVVPFIENKINKTVVDLLLLGGESILKYTAIDLYMRLNACEKALLVYGLLELEQKVPAQIIV